MEIIYTDKDGNTVKFTEEMAIAAITERDELRVSLNDSQDRSTRYYGKLLTVREHVFEFFNSRYDSSSDEIECNVDEVNELLGNISAEQLKKLLMNLLEILFEKVACFPQNQNRLREHLQIVNDLLALDI